MATKYSQPQKENREENNIPLFTGSIMDPFKTGPTGLFATTIMSSCYLEGFTWSGKTVHNGLVFIGCGMDRKCVKSFMANVY